MPRDVLDYTFVLCFTRFERHPGDTVDATDMLDSTFGLCFTRFERYPTDTNDGEGYPIFNVCIVFYTL